MIKLLRVDFARLWKTKVLWVLMLAAFAMGVFNIFFNLPDNWEEQTAHTLLQNGMHYMIFASVFAPLFLGTDYSNGTMRNKLTVGSKRIVIYFSEFLTVSTGCLLIALCELVPMIFAAIYSGKDFGMKQGEFAFGMFTIFCALEAAIGLLTLLGMLITPKSRSTAISIASALMMLNACQILLNFLNQPENLDVMTFTEKGEFVSTGAAEPNPDYIKPGIKRDIMAIASDILPMGQVMQIQSGTPHNKELMPLYSIGILAVSTAAGVMVFRRKDLK